MLKNLFVVDGSIYFLATERAQVQHSVTVLPSRDRGVLLAELIASRRTKYPLDQSDAANSTSRESERSQCIY